MSGFQRPTHTKKHHHNHRGLDMHRHTRRNPYKPHRHSIRFTPHHKRPLLPSKNRQHGHNHYIPPNKFYLGNKEVLWSYDLWIDVNKQGKNNETIMNLLNYIYYYYFMKNLKSNDYLHKNVYDVELLFNSTFMDMNLPISTEKYTTVSKHGKYDIRAFNRSLVSEYRKFYKVLFFHHIGDVDMVLVVNNNGIENIVPITTDTTIILEKGIKYKLDVKNNVGSKKFKLTILDILV
jgi:hypothetical protein